MARLSPSKHAYIAKRILGAFTANTHHRSDGDDALYTLCAAALINLVLAQAHAACRSCGEGLGPELPPPFQISLSDVLGESEDQAVAVTAAREQLASVSAGAPAPGCGEAAVWFRSRIKALHSVVSLAAELGFDVQCWQLAAYCYAPLIAEGALAEATAVSAAGLVAAERCRDERAVALMHLACGAAAKMSGRLSEAMDHYNAAMPIMKRRGDVVGQANVLLSRGAVHMSRRELYEARACQHRVLAITKLPVLTALATGNLGSIAVQAGDFAEAIDCGRAALDIIEGASLPAVRQVMEVNQDLASAYLAQGELRAARRHVDAAVAAADATKDDLTFASVQVAVYRVAGKLALAEGNREAAYVDFTRALTVRSGSVVLLADVLQDIGLAALAGPDRAAAIAILHTALAQRRVNGVGFLTAGTLALLADAYQGGDLRYATELRDEAMELLGDLGDASAARLRERLATV